jgi:hypothetical protein
MTATAFLVFYRFKAMNKEETEKSKDEWNRVKNSLASGIELVGEYVHAWGTEYIMVFCYLKLIMLTHFWIGGQSLRILLDGM